MNFDGLKFEIFQIYRDYERNYAALVCEKIDESQASELNNISKKIFNKGESA